MVSDFPDKTDAVSHDFVRINSIGAHEVRDNTSHILRSRGRSDYHILYLAEGRCDISDNGHVFTLPEKSAWFYEPRQRQEYIKYAGTTYWAHFTGLYIPALCMQLRLSGGRRTPSDAKEFEALFRQAVSLFIADSACAGVRCAAILIQLLTLLAPPGGENDRCAPSRPIYAAAERMRSSPDPFDADFYARSCAMSRSRFYAAFRTVMGVTPLQYVTRSRVLHAQYLLRNTDLSVSEIAHTVGYPDELYFSRLFRKHTGVSPRGYRSGGETSSDT